MNTVHNPTGAPRGRDAIVIEGLRKSYGDRLVLDGIDLRVPEGTVFALLGPNGAGKTTMIQILSTLISADAGHVEVAGHDLRDNPEAVRSVIGVTGQFSAVDNLLTGEENLRLMADLNHLSKEESHERVASLLAHFDLVGAAAETPATYSGGMRRRLDLAMGLINSPRVVFLDEPTTGLDPRGRQAMWQSIRQLVAERLTVFLTTQYLEEADRLADRIAVLDRGRLVAEGSPDELKRLIPNGHVSLRFSEPRHLDHAAETLGDAIRDDSQLAIQVASTGTVDDLRSLLNRLDQASIEVESFTIHQPDLDDVFFALTGGPAATQEHTA